MELFHGTVLDSLMMIATCASAAVSMCIACLRDHVSEDLVRQLDGTFVDILIAQSPVNANK